MRLCLLVVALFITANTFGQRTFKNKQLDAKFGTFETFNWIEGIDNIPDDKIFVAEDGVMIFNNETTRNTIKQAIETQLQERGYDKSMTNPDFLVSFAILEQEATLQGYSGFETTYLGLDTVRAEENVTTQYVGAGTILINLIDNDTKKVVWQGYASGVLDAEGATNNAKIRSVIDNVFDNYNYTALN